MAAFDEEAVRNYFRMTPCVPSGPCPNAKPDDLVPDESFTRGDRAALERTPCILKRKVAHRFRAARADPSKRLI